MQFSYREIQLEFQSMVGKLFFHFQRASISKYISFYRERVPRRQILEIIKESATVVNFNQDTLGHWREMMSEHNSIVERGERMKLLQFRVLKMSCRVSTMSWIQFQCLDLFMLQMQSRYLARLLDEFSSFGERVLRLMQESPTSLLWTIGGQIVVERESWCSFCSQMMTLLHVLGMADPSRLRLSPWPDRELLEAAALRASGVFGWFARADTTMPSVRALLSRHRAHATGNHKRIVRTAAVAASASADGRAGKRRRGGAEGAAAKAAKAAASADGRVVKRRRHPPRRAAAAGLKAGPEPVAGAPARQPMIGS
jgi:hypothetical protein